MKNVKITKAMQHLARRSGKRSDSNQNKMVPNEVMTNAGDCSGERERKHILAEVVRLLMWLCW
jgi:hypothetical protein